MWWLTKYETIAKVLMMISDQINFISSVHRSLCLLYVLEIQWILGFFGLKWDYYLKTWICNSVTDGINLGFADCETFSFDLYISEMEFCQKCREKCVIKQGVYQSPQKWLK